MIQYVSWERYLNVGWSKTHYVFVLFQNKWCDSVETFAEDDKRSAKARWESHDTHSRERVGEPYRDDQRGSQEPKRSGMTVEVSATKSASNMLDTGE